MLNSDPGGEGQFSGPGEEECSGGSEDGAAGGTEGDPTFDGACGEERGEHERPGSEASSSSGGWYRSTGHTSDHDLHSL